MKATVVSAEASSETGRAGHPAANIRLQKVEFDGFPRVPTLTGLDYLKFLTGLHLRRNVLRYLEIGTQWGKSLECAVGRAVAIDPSFRLNKEAMKARLDVAFFEMTSDAFFAAHNPREILGGDIELAFIDGMHLSDFVLRDFVNVERYCAKDSIIVLHDALPQNFEMTERNRRPLIRKDKDLAAAWTGDVWRVIPILKRDRPDLQIEILDCPPTGLVVISNLDPDSNVLSDRFEEISRTLIDAEPEEEEFWSFVESLVVSDSKI